MDGRDREILQLLQTNARISNVDLARELGVAPSAIHERLRKLERRGTILGYHARLAPEALDAELLAFVFVQADDRPDDPSTGEQLAALPEVQEVHHVAGEDCFLVKVRCASTAALGDLLQRKVGAIPAVRRTRTTIVLRTMKETLDLAIPSGIPEVSDATG